MKYATYPLSLEAYARAARKSGMIKARKDAQVKATAQLVYQQYPQMLQTMDFIVHSEEWHWLNSKKIVYYPGSLDVAASLSRAKFSARDAAAFYSGFESFMLAFPKGVMFNNKPAAGCLITICEQRKRALNFLSDFGKVVIGYEPEIKSNEIDGYTIGVNYQTPYTSLGITRLVLSSVILAELLACETVEEHIEVMARHDDFDYAGGLELDAGEQAYQYELIRFILRFLMYKKALPERIEDGLPGIHRKEAETEFSMGRSHRIIQPPRTSKESPAAHYRSWHFRQLTHEKFYRGEHENLAPGSRVVFVSDAYVGQKTTPLTVT